MMLKDIIKGEYFPRICDICVGSEDYLKYSENLTIPDKEYVSIYTKTENVAKALDFINSNPDQKFTLVTHNSDLSIDEQKIPNNIHRWFAQNLNYSHPKLFPLPIGLENTHWAPYKTQEMFRTPDVNTRLVKSFVQLNINTHPERKQLIKSIDNRVTDFHVGANGNFQHYKSFIFNLKKYAFCVCPRGNGIDTHRVWEALYMGCIPICKPYLAHMFNDTLPILFVNEWSDITTDLLTEAYHSVDNRFFDSDLLKISYWQRKINNEI